MMLDVLGLNPDSDGWGRLLLEMSLLFLKTFLGGGKLYSIQHGHLYHQLQRTSLRLKPEESRAERKERERERI